MAAPRLALNRSLFVWFALIFFLDLRLALTRRQNVWFTFVLLFWDSCGSPGALLGSPGLSWARVSSHLVGCEGGGGGSGWRRVDDGI